MSRVIHLISSLGELYKKLFEKESIEENSVDFFLNGLEQQAEENRKKIADLGFWTVDGTYIEDLQEVDEHESRTNQ